MAARTYNLVEMELNSSTTISIPVRSDIITYFGIPVGTTTVQKKTRKVKEHTRKINSLGLTDQTQKTINVPENDFDDVIGRPRKGRGGNKNIRVPSKLVTAKGKVRFATIRIPQIATNYTIALWIKDKFAANQPTYFLTNAGRKYPVNVPASANPNPVLAGTSSGGSTGAAALPGAP